MWVLALLTVLLTGWTTVHETRRWRKAPFADFNNLQTGGECLIAGCDPYDFAALNREAARRDEPKPEIWPMTPVYPPSSLVVLLPFEGLGWPDAAYLFNGVAGLATAAACVLLVWSLRLRAWDAGAIPLLAGLVCVPMVSAIEFANPALLATALIAIACVLLLQSGPGLSARVCTLAWILLGLALSLKPQLAVGPVAILLWRRNTRAAAVKSCALAIVLLLTGLIAYRLRLGSFHFLASLRYALWLSSMPGGSSDFASTESFDFLNLQTALAALGSLSRGAVNALAWLTTAALGAAMLLLGQRCRASDRRPWTLIALAAAISVLPIYHRGYDRVIALLLVPAAVEIGATSRAEPGRYMVWLYAALLTLWIANDTILSHILKRWLFLPQTPVEDVALCGVLLASLWLVPRPGAAEQLVAS